MSTHFWAAVAGSIGIVLYVWESVSALLDRRKVARTNTQMAIKIYAASMEHWAPDAGKALEGPDLLMAQVQAMDRETNSGILWHLVRATLTCAALIASVILAALDHS